VSDSSRSINWAKKADEKKVDEVVKEVKKNEKKKSVERVAQGIKGLAEQIVDLAPEIQKHIKKSFFGTPLEVITENDRTSVPLYKIDTHKRTKLLGIIEQRTTHTILINARTGAILNRTLREESLDPLYKLTEKQLAVCALLQRRERTADALSHALIMPIKEIEKTLASLKKVVSHRMKGENKVWYLIRPYSSSELGTFHHSTLELAHIDVPPSKATLSEDDVIKIIKHFFDADVVTTELIHLPIQRVVLQSRTGSRQLNINLHNGRLLS
jgi:hypothetical protein